MSRVGAFFDLDRTILAGFSGRALVRELVVRRRLGPRDLARVARLLVQMELGATGFSGMLTGLSRNLRGMTEEEFEELGLHVFTKRTGTWIYAESRALIREHLRKGHTVAIVSSALPPQVNPVARDLGIEIVACTRLHLERGKLTGEVVRPTCWGRGKSLEVARIAREKKLDLAKSYYYGDGWEDRHVMETVGHPVPTNPDPRLAKLAAKRGWKVLRFSSRGTPSVASIARTILAGGSIVPSILLAFPEAARSLVRGPSGPVPPRADTLRENALRAVSYRLRPAVNRAIRTWGDLGTRLSGVKLDVQGAEHLRVRPSVFVFNHQSALDMLLICKLLEGDFVGIAKREIASYPLFGTVAMLAGTVFIDRLDRERAIKTLEPVADVLRGGLSVVIAPEGTRTPTPRLKPFKKGAFHLAMAARVPIVPIVIKNAGESLPKRGLVIRPATIEVVVHPPIPTERWKPRDLDRHIAKVHRIFERTLG